MPQKVKVLEHQQNERHIHNMFKARRCWYYCLRSTSSDKQIRRRKFTRKEEEGYVEEKVITRSSSSIQANILISYHFAAFVDVVSSSAFSSFNNINTQGEDEARKQ